MSPKTKRSKAAGGEPAVAVESLIVTMRGQRVILSADLARVYSVEHRTLNQAVRRNSDRFPADFVFRLTFDEAREAARLRSQIVTLDGERIETPEIPRSQSVILELDAVGPPGILRSQSVTLRSGANVKYAPLAFTEHGAVMAATVLNSPRAVQMSIFVVRAFLRLRQLVAGQAELAATLAKLERRVSGHDGELKGIIAALRELFEPPPDPPRRRIGFARRDDEPASGARISLVQPKPGHKQS